LVTPKEFQKVRWHVLWCQDLYSDLRVHEKCLSVTGDYIKSDIDYLLPKCHVHIKVRIEFIAWEHVTLFFKTYLHIKIDMALYPQTLEDSGSSSVTLYHLC
jgi:hypothetical protein